MEGLFAPAVTNTTRLTNRNPPVMCASAPTTGGISILLILVPTEAIQQRCHWQRLADFVAASEALLEIRPREAAQRSRQKHRGL